MLKVNVNAKCLFGVIILFLTEFVNVKSVGKLFWNNGHLTMALNTFSILLPTSKRYTASPGSKSYKETTTKKHTPKSKNKNV